MRCSYFRGRILHLPSSLALSSGPSGTVMKSDVMGLLSQLCSDESSLRQLVQYCWIHGL